MSVLPRMTIAALLALGGCTMMGPDYRRPALSLPPTFAEPASQGNSASIPAQWWKLFEDAQLDALVTAATERNADLRLAVAQVEEALGALREADASLLPQIDANASGQRQRISAATATPIPPTVPLSRNLFVGSLSTAFEIDFWGRLRRAQEAVRAQVLATEFARDVTALTLTATVAQAYFALRSLDAQIAVLSHGIASRAQTLTLTRNRARRGLASDLDIAQAEAAHADAVVQHVELQRQRSVVAHQLASLTGQSDLGLPVAGLDALPVPPSPAPGLPSSLLDRRPDIRAAEALLASANARIGVARAAMFPTISLTGSLGGQSAALSDLLSVPARIGSLGVGITVPVFDAGRLAARTEQAEARQRQSLANYQRAIDTALREVADALVNVERTAAAEQALRQRADAARTTLRLAQARYEAGYSGFLEVLDAQRTQNDVDLALVRNRQSRLAYSVDLMRSLGGGWQPESVLSLNGERSSSSSR
jgi:multidrug efflux system outer membrane protein